MKIFCMILSFVCLASSANIQRMPRDAEKVQKCLIPKVFDEILKADMQLDVMKNDLTAAKNEPIVNEKCDYIYVLPNETKPEEVEMNAVPLIPVDSEIIAVEVIQDIVEKTPDNYRTESVPIAEKPNHDQVSIIVVPIAELQPVLTEISGEVPKLEGNSDDPSMEERQTLIETFQNNVANAVANIQNFFNPSASNSAASEQSGTSPVGPIAGFVQGVLQNVNNIGNQFQSILGGNPATTAAPAKNLTSVTEAPEPSKLGEKETSAKPVTQVKVDLVVVEDDADKPEIDPENKLDEILQINSEIVPEAETEEIPEKSEDPENPEAPEAPEDPEASEVHEVHEFSETPEEIPVKFVHKNKEVLVRI